MVAPPAPSPGPEVIQTVVRERHGDLRQCYIAGALANSSLAGTVSVVFTIETDGSVSTANDGGSDLADKSVVACVLGVFSDLRFPPGGASPTEVTYPVNFGSRG